MDNSTSVISSDPVKTMDQKLDDLLVKVDALVERQQINDDIMLEMVNFLVRFREDVLEAQQAGDKKIQLTAEAAVVKASELVQSNVKLAEVVTTGLRDVRAAAAQSSVDQFRSLQQLVQVGLRKLPATGGKVRCVFLVHMIEAWDAQIDIYEAMRADARFEPIVVSINRKFPGDVGYGGEDVVSRNLSELGIQHLRLGTQSLAEAQGTLRNLGPDVIFRQSHWDNDYPPAFSTSELAFTRLCVVPYGMSIVQKFNPAEQTQLVSPMAFDQPYHRSAWRIFCETEQTRSYFQSFRQSDPNKFVLSGYPKHERLMKSIGHGSWPIADTGKKAYRVIWAPHHSLGKTWLGFGVFHRIYIDMLRLAERNEDIQFVLKPHPALFSLMIAQKLVSQADFDEFRRRWLALPNCTIFTGQYAELFDASDLMLTDGLSFLTEYQLFDKPLVFIDSQNHVPLNALGELAVECADTVINMNEIEQTLRAYAAGKHQGHDEPRARLRAVMFPNERPSVDVIVDAIAEGLGVEGKLISA